MAAGLTAFRTDFRQGPAVAEDRTHAGIEYKDKNKTSAAQLKPHANEWNQDIWLNIYTRFPHSPPVSLHLKYD